MSAESVEIEARSGPSSVEHLIQLGMRAAIRDIQDYVAHGTWRDECSEQAVLSANELRAYLLALLITAGAYDDLRDVQG